jgi:hypothetical protein
MSYRLWGCTRIVPTHAMNNTASCGIAQKASFELEGPIRMAKRLGDGRLYDEHLYALLATSGNTASYCESTGRHHVTRSYRRSTMGKWLVEGHLWAHSKCASMAATVFVETQCRIISVPSASAY